MYNKLKGRIIEKYGSQKSFAKALGQTEQWISLKMTGKSGFTATEIEKWSALLDIPRYEIGEYFFYNLICENA